MKIRHTSPLRGPAGAGDEVARQKATLKRERNALIRRLREVEAIAALVAGGRMLPQ